MRHITKLRIRQLITYLIGVSPVCVCSSANAEFFSSANLYQWLENDMNGIESYEGGMSKGYLMGAMDMLASTLPPTICVPKNTGISAYELNSVVYTYMATHPDMIKEKPDKVVYQALSEHWSCK